MKVSWPCFIVLFLLLSSSIALAQDAPKKKTQKPVSTATAVPPSGPTKEETVEFILNASSRCSGEAGEAIDENDVWAFALYSESEAPHFSDSSLTEIVWYQRILHFKDSRPADKYDVTKDSYTTDLAQMDPASVNLRATRLPNFFVDMTCSSGNCVDIAKYDFSGVKKFITAKSVTGNSSVPRKDDKYSLKVCGPREDAGRVAKAIRHLIELYGGKPRKAPLF